MCVCVPVFLPIPVPGRVSPTWDGHLASSKDHRKAQHWGSAAGSLAGGRIHAAAHGGPAADAAGGILEGFHATVPLDVQVLQPPALPALPKLHLDLPWEKEERGKRKPSGKPTAHKMALLLY